MKIVAAEVCLVRWPFLAPVEHSLAVNRTTDNIVVVLISDEGWRGYGEGIARSYVTGEATTPSLRYLRAKLLPALMGREVETEGLLRVVREEAGEEALDRHPAACCAVEIALLDLAGRALGVPVCELLGGCKRRTLTYSGVVPLRKPQAVLPVLETIRSFGMTEIKLKVGRDDDLARAALAREVLGDEVDLRADANGAWSAELAAVRLESLERFRLSAIEQPVAPGDLEGMRRVRRASRTRVLADESACTPAQAAALINAQAIDGLNLKLSKCGGPARALDMLSAATSAGLVCTLGSQVGELGLLGAAGRHFAASQPGLIHLEGCLTRFYIAQDLVHEDLTPGFRGSTAVSDSPGLGVTVAERSLADSLLFSLKAS